MFMNVEVFDAIYKSVCGYLGVHFPLTPLKVTPPSGIFRQYDGGKIFFPQGIVEYKVYPGIYLLIYFDDKKGLGFGINSGDVRHYKVRVFRFNASKYFPCPDKQFYPDSKECLILIDEVTG